MKVLITGANGMLGQDLSEILLQKNYEVIKTDVAELDITDKNRVYQVLEAHKPDFIIHAAAYTNVDKAEDEPETAFLINETGSENIAKASASLNIPMVYISTDYVFDGTKNSPYIPSDKTNPINVYGMSKLKGEEAVIKNNPNHYIARTSWLYGHKGKNFVETIINLAKEKTELKVVSDQTGCPTWTKALSGGIIELLETKKPYGIYNICGSGYTSWYGFASKILEIINSKTIILPVSTDEFPRKATRPKYSVMNNQKICPDWEISLNNYIKERKV